MIQIKSCIWCSSTGLRKIAIRKDGTPVGKCKNCLLVMNLEFPKNPEDYYHEDYFNAVEAEDAKGYEAPHYLVSPAFLFWQNAYIETIAQGAKNRFLEIGAATGNLLEILQENQPSLDLFGIDVSNYAVEVSRAKGFDVRQSFIEDFSSDEKMDIIFSSETMEHLDDLRSFLTGVKNNLAAEGVFLFYVPSISQNDAEREKNKYVRFNVNMEHLLHFSPEFFSNEMTKFFDAHIVVKEFKTSFGPSIVGAISKKADRLEELKKIFDTLESGEIPKKSSQVFLKNLLVFSLKFGQFDLFDRAKSKIDNYSTEQKALIEGLEGYHKGELEKATEAFKSYIKERPESRIGFKLLVSNYQDLAVIYRKDIDTKANIIQELKTKNDFLENELHSLKSSRIIRRAIKAKAAADLISARAKRNN